MSWLSLLLAHVGTAQEIDSIELAVIRYEQSLSGATRHASLGGELRQRYEYVRHPGFGADPQDKHGVWLQRFAVHADAPLNERLRTFVEVHSALEEGRAGGPGPADQNELELQNLFIELHASSDVLWRVGRQELQLGSARLVSVRDGPNVRRTFDGARAELARGAWRVSALWAQPRTDRVGVFDDGTDEARTLWGVYATHLMEQRGFDVYYLGYRRHEALFDQGAGAERRHTLGIRSFGELGPWSWNIEPMVQFGSFDGARLRAWTVASKGAYSWEETRLRPRLALSVNIASGDRDPSDADLETFNPLFPRGNYFSEDALLGPQNFYNAHVFLILSPHPTWSITADYNAFFRLSTSDGVYSPSGALLASHDGSPERFVATGLSLTSIWTPSPGWEVSTIYAHSTPRAFLREAGLSRAVHFFELTARYRF